MLNEYVTAVRAETVWAEGTVEIAGASPADQPEPAGQVEPAADGSADLRITGWLEPLKSTWSRTGAPRTAHPRADPAGHRLV